MTGTRASHKATSSGWLHNVRHWLSHPTSEVLPPIFGDAVPPDMRVLQARVEDARHEIQERPAPRGVRRWRSKPARRN